MFLKKFQFASQVVGTVTLLVLALYGLMGHPPSSAAASAAEIVPVEMSISENAPSAQWGDSTVPLVMDYKGYVRGAEGQSLSGYYTITFRLDGEVIASEALWSETHEDVTVRDGYFSVLLGNNSAMPADLFKNQPDRFIGVTIDPYDEMVPRQRVASVPYAMHSDHASEADHAIEADRLNGLNAGELVPAGLVMAYAGELPPAGWVVCDGSEVSRTDYPELFAAIGTAHGEGDGTTTFNLPDYRGLFLRGVDAGAGRDSDVDARTAPNTGGNTGDAVGSVQDDQLQSHKHEDAGHAHGYTSQTHHDRDGSGWGSGSANDSWSGYATGAGHANLGDPVDSETGGGEARHGVETRPKNASVIWIIKD